MSKLSELQEMIAGLFEAAQSKEDIDKASKLKAKAEEAQAEQDALANENKELVKDLKEMAIHGTVSKEKPKEPAGTPVKSFEESLEEFYENIQKEKKE